MLEPLSRCPFKSSTPCAVRVVFACREGVMVRGDTHSFRLGKCARVRVVTYHHSDVGECVPRRVSVQNGI